MLGRGASFTQARMLRSFLVPTIAVTGLLANKHDFTLTDKIGNRTSHLGL